MIIKEIIIQGFKSFKDKAIITIDEPVVGIVGPNGCGKSNIVDAMKWVLGEQSPKSLRGGSMDDVIYNGGAHGKGAGRAEVSIKFSTQDGIIPSKYLNFSEIQVTRRLYKSGESEYLINKTTCRLKDIHDLIMGTGAGARAYAIVSQGQIDKFTMAKPTERRFYIEEAAGITRYKVRKEAAERKILSTKQNLLRINDIIKELQRQNTSLKRQADAAERYKKLKDELRELELHLAAISQIELMESRTISAKSCEDLKAEINGIETTINAKELSIEDRKLAKQEEETFISSLQEKVYEGMKIIQQSESDIKIRQKEIEELDSRKENDAEYLDGLKNKLSELTEEDDLLGDSSSSSIGDIDKEKELLDQRDSEFRNKKAQLTIVTEEKETHKEAVIKLLTGMSQTRNRLQFVDENLSTQDLRLKQKDSDRNDLKTKREELETKSNTLNNDLESLKNAKGQAIIEKEALNEKLEEWTKELSINQTDYDSVKEELTKKSSRLTSLEELRKQYDGYQDGVKNMMLNYPKKEILHGLVGDTLSIDPKFEVALESVLGESFQGIIVNNFQEGTEAVSHLRTSSGGRSSFLPLNIRSVTKHVDESLKSVESLQTNSFLGYLRDKISVKNEYEPIVDHLFKDVAIVEDLEAATQIWQDQPIKDTMVTLAGDVISPEGFVSGGALDAISSGILQKKREIEELNERIDELEVKHTLITETIRRIQESVDEAEEKADTLVRMGHAEDLKILNLEKDLASVNEDINRINNNINVIELEMERIREESSELETQCTEMKRILENNEISKCDYEKKILQIENEESGLRNFIESEAESITEMKIRFASLKERMESFEARKSRLSRDIEEVQANIKDFENKIEDAALRQRTS